MSDIQNGSERISRRSMLQTSAGVAAAGMAGVALGAQRIRRGAVRRPAVADRQTPLGVVTPLRPPTAEEKRIANEIAERIKQEILLVVSNPRAKFAAGSYAALVQNSLRRKPALSARLTKQSAKMKRTVSRGKTLGTAASAVASPIVLKKAMGDRLKLAVKHAPKVVFRMPSKKVTLKPGVFKDLFYNKVGFYLKRVKCLEETNEIGSDEILLGGHGIDPTGKIIKIPQWKVSNDFDKGETRWYTPHRKVVEYSLAAGNYWPKPYVITLAMGEEDGGGFYDILKSIWDKVGKEVSAAIGAAVGAAIGAAVGSSVPVIGTIIGAVVGALIGWLITLFDNPDDFVDLVSWTLWLGARHKPYFQSLGGLTYQNDQFIAPPGWMKFRGDGGKYDAELYWKVWK